MSTSSDALTSYWKTTFRELLKKDRVSHESIVHCAQAAQRHAFQYEVSESCRHIDAVKKAFAEVYGDAADSYLSVKRGIVPVRESVPLVVADDAAIAAAARGVLRCVI